MYSLLLHNLQSNHATVKSCLLLGKILPISCHWCEAVDLKKKIQEHVVQLVGFKIKKQTFLGGIII